MIFVTGVRVRLHPINVDFKGFDPNPVVRRLERVAMEHLGRPDRPIAPAPELLWLRKMIVERALTRGDYVLSGGVRSDYYIDKFRLFSDPHVLRRIARLFTPLIAELNPDIIGGTELGGVVIATAVSQLCGPADDRGAQTAQGLRRVCRRVRRRPVRTRASTCCCSRTSSPTAASCSRPSAPRGTRIESDALRRHQPRARPGPRAHPVLAPPRQTPHATTKPMTSKPSSAIATGPRRRSSAHVHEFARSVLRAVVREQQAGRAPARSAISPASCAER